MRNLNRTLATILLAAATAGCDSQSGQVTTTAPQTSNVSLPAMPAPCGVAVVDLNILGTRFGRLERINATIAERKASMNQELAAIKESFDARLAEKQQEIGERPSEQQVAELTEMQKELSQRFADAQKTANTELANLPVQLVNAFRDDVKPIARQVAAEHGCKIVLNQTDQVLLTFDESVDITEQVIARMQAVGYTAARESTPPRR